VILGTFHFQIVKDGTTDFNAGIGTGPFKVKEFKPGVRSIAVRNEGYWKTGRPYLDEIEFIGIGDESARINALLSGELDLVAFINPRSVPRINQSPGHAVFETQAGQYTDLVIRRDAGPGTNPEFVLAMKYLQDREQMKRSVALGHAVLANDQPIDPTNRFYFAGLPQRAFDLDKAKFHLQKANLGSSPIPVVVSPAAQYSVELAGRHRHPLVPGEHRRSFEEAQGAVADSTRWPDGLLICRARVARSLSTHLLAGRR
jgi:peptide/nickel transport system substrate-binding protein